jgi:hypothetical protein
LGRKLATVLKSLQWAAVATAVDIGLSVAAAFAFSMDLLSTLGLALLLEAAALMLVGGALSFSGQPSVRNLTSMLTGKEHKVTKADLDDLELRAAAVALVGVLLFVESLALAAATV